MNKKIKIALIVIVVIAIIYFFIKIQPKNAKRNSIDNIYQKWSNIASAKNTTIDEQKIKVELDKLTDEDLRWLNNFTDKVTASQGVLDYLSLAGDIRTFKTIIAKTNLSAMVDAVVFANLIKN